MRTIANPLGSQEESVEGLPLGGPGSGNWGHEGRPGHRGGSRPGTVVRAGERVRITRGMYAGSMGTVVEAYGNTVKVAIDGLGDRKFGHDEVLSTSGADPRVRQLARKLRAQAEAVEPALTETIQGTVEALGGGMAGLDFRLKSEESIRSKLGREAAEAGVSVEDAAKGLTDLVRYTAIFEPGKLVEGAQMVQDALETQGWSRYDHKWRNYFAPGNSYQGYNTVYVNKDGLRFELQFHTRESHRIKEAAHTLYDQVRELPADSPRRVELMVQMASLWEGFQRPTGWDSLPGDIIKTTG